MRFGGLGREEPLIEEAIVALVASDTRPSPESNAFTTS